jgi:hypothetical protein
MTTLLSIPVDRYRLPSGPKAMKRGPWKYSSPAPWALANTCALNPAGNFNTAAGSDGKGASGAGSAQAQSDKLTKLAKTQH